MATLWNCATDHTQVTVPPARTVTLAGLKVMALALTVALAGAPAGWVGVGGTAVGGTAVGGAAVGGTAVGGTGVATAPEVGGEVGAVVAAAVAVAGTSPLEVVAVAEGLAAGDVGEGLDDAVAEAEADAAELLAGAVLVAFELSEPPQAARANAPRPTRSVAKVFTGGVSGAGYEGMFARRTLACMRRKAERLPSL